MNWYNEIDAYAAQWIRNLGAAGHIGVGRVDERSIEDLAPTDLAGVRRAHFFAGIGCWDYALRLAGFPDEVEVWTGSCPCQPFSIAGRGKGVSDERHLWPAWFKLIDKRRPAIIFGEQVASPAGLGWLDSVCADLEGAGYSVGAADLPASSVGAPHKRSRLFFCAYASGFKGRLLSGPRRSGQADPEAERGGETLGGAYSSSDATRKHARELRGDESQHEERPAVGNHRPVDRGAARDASDSAVSGLPLSERNTRARGETPSSDQRQDAVGGRAPSRAGEVGWLDLESTRRASESGATRGFWGGCDWYSCRDGKSRPIESGLQPLAHGTSGRMGKLRAYGNAIVPQVAAAFISSFMEAITQ